jgi:hypothetical protein
MSMLKATVTQSLSSPTRWPGWAGTPGWPKLGGTAATSGAAPGTAPIGWPFASSSGGGGSTTERPVDMPLTVGGGGMGRSFTANFTWPATGSVGRVVTTCVGRRGPDASICWCNPA